MADRYAVGTGNWNNTSTWAASSGGSTGESVPVDGDDVYFDANSGTVTLNAAARCDKITFNGGGTLDTDSSNDYAFTVDERMYLQSGGTFNANGSTVKIGDGVVGSEYTLQATNGTFNGGDGVHTIGSIKVNGGTCNLSGGTTTINGAESSSSAGCLQKTSAGTLAHNNGTVIFDVQNFGGSIILLYGGDITLYRVYLDATASNQRLKLWGAGATSPRRKLTVVHNLTIRGGTFRTQHSSVEECDLDVGGDLLLEPSASAGTDVKAQFEAYDAVVNVSGKLETRGTWNSGGGNYTPKSIYNGGTGTHSYQGINFLVGTDVTLSSGVTSITGAVNGSGAGTAFRSDVQNGYNTYSNGSGTVKFTSPNDQHLYSTGQQADNFTQFHNLTLEKTSSTLQGLTTVGFHIKVGNDLLITSGILNTNTTSDPPVNHDLTVTKKTELTGSGATLTLNDSTCSFGSNQTVGGLTVSAGSTTVTAGGSSNITLGSIYATYDGSVNIRLEGTNTVNSYDASNDRIIRLPNATVDADSAFTVTTTTTNKRLSVYDANISLTLTPSSATNYFIYNINGMDVKALTINANATLNCKNSASGSDRNLTVAEELSCAGTLTGNSSTVTARNLLITAGTFTAPDNSGSLILTGEGSSGSGDGYVFRRTGGTFTHSGGTLTITTPDTTSIRMGGVGSGQRFNTVILDESSSSPGLLLQTNDEGFYCEGDLTLTDGDFNLNSAVDLLTVEGNVTVGANNTLGGITSTQTTNNSFGSLTIASGGEAELLLLLVIQQQELGLCIITEEPLRTIMEL